MEVYDAIASWIGWPSVVALLIILGSYGGWLMKNRIDILNQELSRVSRGDKPIEHYLLFWERGRDDWAEEDWVAARDYVARFHPVCGFSRYEAAYANKVTIVGAESGVDKGAEQFLSNAGCKVERLDGNNFEDTALLLEERVKQGVAFKGGVFKKGYG